MNTKPRATTSLRWSRAVAQLVVTALGIVAWTQPAEANHCSCDISVESGSTEVISSSRTVDCIDVPGGGTLKINGNVTLTLTGPGPSCVDGTVILKAGASVLAFTTNDHTVTGSGKIEGLSDNAGIDIVSGVTLTSDVKITGRMQITGAGNFTTEGRVTTGPGGGTLDIRVTGTIDDEVGASWVVEGVGAVLRFRTEPASLQGDFTVTDGELRAGIDPDPVGDDIDVCTTGNLTHTGGKIVALVNDSFKFGGTCP